MSKISESLNRNKFQKESYLKRKLKEGKTPENDAAVKAMSDYFDSLSDRDKELINDPNWRENNLEYDLRCTEWILEKVRNDDIYAQNLYAALCNNQFQKLEIFSILKEEIWYCSWRHAGGIIADMRQTGDYIDWYCSGSRGHMEHVLEGHVTDEVRKDLKRLGWCVSRWKDFT